MKRLSILITLLIALLVILTGCDNGSASDSAMTKTSNLAKVCLTLDTGTSMAQKTIGVINDSSLIYKYKAEAQWSGTNIQGETDWTEIVCYDGSLMLGYFTPGPWTFSIGAYAGDVKVYEGSTSVTIGKGDVHVNVLLSEVAAFSPSGVVTISVTAPTVQGDGIVVSYGNTEITISDNAITNPDPYDRNISRSNGITTFECEISGLTEGSYTFTLNHSSYSSGSAVAVDFHKGEHARITGHLDNGVWKLGYLTLNVHSINILKYNWNTGTWESGMSRYFYGNVYSSTSAAPGERVTIQAKPVANSSVVEVLVNDVACSGSDELYSFRMPDGDVTVKVKFAVAPISSVEIDTLLFRSLVQAFYAEHINSIEKFGIAEDLPEGIAATLGDVQIWYDSNAKKICWHSPSGNMLLSEGSLADLFKDGTAYKNISLEGIDAHNITDMSGMFDGCSNLTTLTLNEFTANTTDPVNMARMFKGCEKLTGSLNFSGFNGSKASNMASMFEGCSGLTAIDLSGLSSDGRPSSMSCMFKDCTQLRSVDISNINTSQVSSMASMFEKAGYDGITLAGRNGSRVEVTENDWYLSITGLNSNNFDTQEVRDMSYMFHLCSAKTLDVSNFKPYKVTNFFKMFAGWSSDDWQQFKCTKFEALDVSNWKVGSGVTAGTIDLSRMFNICQMVQTIAFTPEENPANEAAGTAWDFSRVTDMTAMFDRCEKLAKIVFPKHTDLNNVTSLLNVFNHITLMPVTPTVAKPYGNFVDILKRWDIKNNNHSPSQGGGIDFVEEPYDEIKTGSSKGDSANRIISSDCPSALKNNKQTVTSYGTDYGAGGPTVTLGGEKVNGVAAYTNAYAYQRLKK